ncbi:glycosyltransferase family 1 protein [Armillaria borealis]|uniref:UDP-N-acetylglucosamine transferase subunit ALG14 n=1 Tax=Armillaria borealis TaxID=47425 RepID=A0AA39K4Z9_9AGAR|nr:glycosyltransferase family 1 protein [Armillaria borealis]
MVLSLSAIGFLIGVAACVLRIFSLLPAQKSSGRTRLSDNTSGTRKLAVFLGSGGHTSEAIALLSSLDYARFSSRIYIVSDGDTLSTQKAKDLEYKKCASLSEQNPFADVLILNGPGTCLSLCIPIYVNKFIGLPVPKLIYVESFARVHSLSLSGKLLRPLVDRFVVQWPQPLTDGGRGDCFGWLV